MKISRTKIIFTQDYKNLPKGTKGLILTGVGNFYTIKVKKKLYKDVPRIFVKRDE